jgi:integrase
LHALIAEYRASQAFLARADSTRHDYARYLGLIEIEFGSMPIAALDDPAVRGVFKEWRDAMAGHPRKADMAWSVLSRVLSFAYDRGRILRNPCERGGRLYHSDRADIIWTEDDIARAIASFPAHIRWPFVFALWTGQRQGDLLRLTWNAFDSRYLHLKQSKTKRRVTIPVSGRLAQEIADIPRVSPIMLTNSRGKPWTSDGFRSSWDTAYKKAGISGVTFNDLRGTAITRLAEAGCTDSEIVTITGHKRSTVQSILDRYQGRTVKLAENAIRRLESMDREQKLQTGCKPVRK